MSPLEIHAGKIAGRVFPITAETQNPANHAGIVALLHEKLRKNRLFAWKLEKLAKLP